MHCIVITLNRMNLCLYQPKIMITLKEELQSGHISDAMENMELPRTVNYTVTRILDP